MMVKIAFDSNVIGLRIAAIRQQYALTQRQFATKLSDYLGRTKPISVSSISSLESGRKKPSLSTLAAIAGMCNVSTDYLLGLIDEKGVRDTDDGDDMQGNGNPLLGHGTLQSPATQLIPPSKYRLYHNRPVFVSFLAMERADQWGILDATNQEVVFSNDRIRYVETKVKLFATEPYHYRAQSQRSAAPISGAEFMNTAGRVWVELKTADETMRALYDGYYVFNTGRTAIVNVANGEVLPVNGFGISYTAYREPYDDCLPAPAGSSTAALSLVG